MLGDVSRATRRSRWARSRRSVRPAPELKVQASRQLGPGTDLPRKASTLRADPRLRHTGARREVRRVETIRPLSQVGGNDAAVSSFSVSVSNPAAVAQSSASTPRSGDLPASFDHRPDSTSSDCRRVRSFLKSVLACVRRTGAASTCCQTAARRSGQSRPSAGCAGPAAGFCCGTARSGSPKSTSRARIATAGCANTSAECTPPRPSQAVKSSSGDPIS